MLTVTSLDAPAQMLADPLRARIVELLAHETMCTCHLVVETGARQTTVSHHLHILREAGWVECEPCGRFTYYRLCPEPLAALAASVDALARSAAVAAGRRRPC
ncbi:MAG: metalloregulator ArsR/SmtB family transcription factor [Actinomycetota bacterium]|jgi:ArsR family transcriptional regulator|nr:metalloregulator ArsR/SmtB family transcription factor [Actinomycetota bacterium]